MQIAEEIGLTEDESMSILPLIYLHEINTLVVVYRDMDGYLYMISKPDNGEWSKPLQVSDRVVVTNPVDSGQVAADAVAHDNRVFVTFISEENCNIYISTVQINEGLAVEAPQIKRIVADIDGSWVRGQVLLNQSLTPVYGLVYDAGSLGGSGFNKYIEIPLNYYSGK